MRYSGILVVGFLTVGCSGPVPAPVPAQKPVAKEATPAEVEPAPAEEVVLASVELEAEPIPPEPAPAPPAERLVVFTPDGPMVLDAWITVDGEPRGLASELAIDLALAAADMDGDGWPTWEELAVNTAFFAGPVGSAIAPPNADELDADRDGRVDRNEARSWLTGGVGDALAVKSSRSYAIDPRRSPLWRALDADESGALSEEEVAGASERLGRRDANDDLIIDQAELLSLADLIAARERGMMASPDDSYRGEHHAALAIAGPDDCERFGYTATLLYGRGRWLAASGFGIIPKTWIRGLLLHYCDLLFQSR